jgi:2-keto-4-pentenoate hydratase/2-oxohepta-3-ene-1,7-dioic acid hydratase in catechol pathway/regulator of RNase E activity RraA
MSMTHGTQDQLTQNDLIANAGKVIAVHINYASRAAERGRTPEVPSYFLKPTSSLSAGGPVERHAGCELFAYEGEIAVVIGRTARRVSPEEAWGYVAGVTASNDLGVYDLRAADKGSNLRSKGGDGYTPVGPNLIPADTVDPAKLRVRTWLDGELVQDDTTENLLFPLPLLIADLSQVITLEPGDIILTGTPAGASVALPGQTLEVEVTGEDSATSGRLVSTVTEGTEAFADFGAQPEQDEKQREEAWGSRAPKESRVESAADSAPASVITPEIRERLEKTATATLSAQMRKLGIVNCAIEGLHATKPGAKVIGLARTLRYVPNREDLFKEFGGGFNAQKRAIESLGEGDILVMDARGEAGSGTYGDILALRAQVRGAAAIISDGGIRDRSAVEDLDIPTFYQYVHPSVLGRRHVPWAVDETIACGGTTVQPGDVIVADEDGIVVIPPALVDQVSRDAAEQETQDAFVFDQVKNGHSIDGLFPPNAEWKAAYEAWKAERP